MRLETEIESVRQPLKGFTPTLAQPNLPPHPLLRVLRKEPVLICKERSGGRQPHRFHSRDKRLIAGPALGGVPVAVGPDLCEIILLSADGHENRCPNRLAGIAFPNGHDLHVLPPIGKLIYNGTLARRHLDLEIEAGGAGRQASVTIRELPARGVER